MLDVTSTADLFLRGVGRVRVTWPAATDAPPPLAVCVGSASFDGPAVVLTVTNLEAATSVLEWCADHGAELGGDPRRLIVAGESAEVVAALARRARDRGWPPIERTVVTRQGEDR
jgi:hypothetical protein